MARDETWWTGVLRQFFTYDPLTGEFLRDGKPNGCVDKLGYRRVTYQYRWISAQRAAWLFTHGAIPPGMVIDHINGNPSDNRIANLRPITQAENCQNRVVASRTNKTGFLGVHRKRRKYRAAIGISGQRIYLGLFSTPEEASAAYFEAKRKFHPAFVER